jgi:hypothetical protein
MDLFFDDEFSTSEPRDFWVGEEVLQQLQLRYQESAGDPTAQANYSSQIKAIQIRMGRR